MFRAILGLAIIANLAHTPDLKAGKWRTASEATYEEPTEPDEHASERKGKLFLAGIAAIILIVVIKQLYHELRDMSPGTRVIYDPMEDDGSGSVADFSILLPVPFDDGEVECT